MNKSHLIAVFALLISLQTPQVSYSQESDAKVCMGDCMVVHPEEKIPDIKDVYFDPGEYTLDAAAKGSLKKNAEYLTRNKHLHVEIQGHTDENRGNNENITLGEKRAVSVKTYLVSLGIERERLHMISYGEEKPFCIQSNEECWKLNNRVHFMISK